MVFLTQTDTTVGFLSYDAKKLSSIKQRNENQKILQVLDSFDTLKSKTRIPKKYHHFVRKSTKTTFIYPNQESYRVVFEGLSHYNLISKVKNIYSTSANLTGCSFEKEWAIGACDIIVGQELCELQGSKIYRITQKNKKRIR